MRPLPPLLFAIAFLMVIGTASAQTADPFGAPAKADPFGDTNDPFGGSAKPPQPVDPFAPARPTPRVPRRTNPKKVEFVPQTNRPVGVSPGRPQYLKGQTARQTAENRIRAGLAQPTTQTFIQLPLSEALRTLSETHDLPIVLDTRALEEIGLSASESVTISLKNVTLRSFLRLMLRDLDLTYIVKNEVLQITTAEAAEGNLQIEAYPFPEALVGKSDKVVAALTASVHPQVWSTLGGPSSVSVVDNVLVVSATEATHEAVQEFLEKLEAAFQAYLAKQSS